MRLVLSSVLLGLVWFVVVNAVATLAAWTLGYFLSRRPGPVGASRLLPVGASRLLIVRLLPAAVSSFFVLAVFLPAHWRFEPVDSDESFGVVLLEMLNIVEPLDLKAKGLLTPPALHLQIEAMRRAYLDRARYLGDPDFVDVPVTRLTSKKHARTVAATITPDKASSSVELGKDILTVPAEESARVALPAVPPVTGDTTTSAMPFWKAWRTSGIENELAAA